jgi:Sec-independent protein translocase protein TatA
MDTLCGIGLPELLILALLGFVVIGPERSRDLALKVGRWLGTAMRSRWWRELTEVTQALRNMPTTLVRLAEIEDAQADLQRTLSDISRQSPSDVAGQPDNPSAQPPRRRIENPWGIRPVEPGTSDLQDPPAMPSTGQKGAENT